MSGMRAVLLQLVLIVALVAGEPPPSGLPPIIDVSQVTFATDEDRKAGLQELQRLEAAVQMVAQRVSTLKQADDQIAWQTFAWITKQMETRIQNFELWHPAPGLTSEQLLEQGLVRTFGQHPFREQTPAWLQEWADFRKRARAKAEATDLLVQTQRDLERLRDALARALGITGY